MKEYRLVLCVVVCLLTAPLLADEPGDDLEQIPSCGAIVAETRLWQGPNYERSVHGYSQLRRNWDGCLSKLRVEAWVEGVVMSPAIHEGWGIAVSVSYGVPVPHYQYYNAVAKNFLVNFGQRLWAGWSSGGTEMRPPPSQSPMDDQYLCEVVLMGRWYGGSCEPPNCPLIFDRDGDGFDLTSAEDGVKFDIDGDGDLDEIAWTKAGSGDAWLALDRNGNGRIDNGAELFGNHTPAYMDRRLLTASDGFAALDLLQSPEYGVSYSDFQMDRRDALFGKLLLWTDINHNGISESDELQLAADAGLISVSTNSVERKRRDRYGNEFRLKGESWFLNQRGKPRREVVWDVWLRSKGSSN